MKKLYIVLLAIMMAILLSVGIYSVVDVDETTSLSEKRELAKAPEFSLANLLNGSYISQMEEHYSDTFPGREKLLGLNRTMNQFYYYSPGDENMLVIEHSGGAEQGGEALHDMESLMSGETPETPAPKPTTPDEPEPISQPPEEEGGAGEEEPEIPELDVPDESEAVSAGYVTVVGNRAMEVPTATYSVIDEYAAALDNLSSATGFRTISLVTPNAAEFYTPESLHTGSHSQKDMIDYCYGKMDGAVLTVDAYSSIREHVDEYIYFRTDHHWTALGAYYAYLSFCKTAGFEPVTIERYSTGKYEGFVGSMYNYTQGYPQSEMLKNDPDTLTYYLPVVENHAKYYSDTSLSDGVPISVVYTKLDPAVSNKYLCFIAGDTPITIVETEVDGPVCMVLKESYGNALVPFLTNHYSKIIVIDPRKFNQSGMPSLNIKSFGESQGVDDLIAVNYIYKICDSTYIKLLNRLVS